MTKLIIKNQELHKVKAELAELKKSRASQHGVGEEGPVCSKSLAPAPALCQVTSCIPGKRPRKTGPLPTKWNDLDSRNKEIIMKEFNLPENIKRVCKPCSTWLNRRIGVLLAIQKFNMECDQQKKNPVKKPVKKSKRLYSILKPHKNLSLIELDHSYCSVVGTATSTASTANIERVDNSTQTYGKVSIISEDRKYSKEEIRKATLVMYSSRCTYDLLRSFNEERLPSPRTIQRHLQNFRCYYGVNDEMFFLLEQKFKTLPEMLRNVSICFDEMSLQPTTNYSTRFKERLPKSRKALTVMVRGLLASFKEIVYYNFEGVLKRDRDGKSDIDLELLVEIITRVERAGGVVRSICMDMGNRTLMSELKVKFHLLHLIFKLLIVNCVFVPDLQASPLLPSSSE